MCYSNCPYENYHGECTQPKMIGTKYSHCCDDSHCCDEENNDEYEEKEVFEKEDEFDDSNCN